MYVLPGRARSRRFAAAAPASIFVTSIVGPVTHALLSLAATGDVAPIGRCLSCGAGGLLGGFLGARLQPHLPETALRLLLDTLATRTGTLQAARIVR